MYTSFVSRSPFTDSGFIQIYSSGIYIYIRIRGELQHRGYGCAKDQQIAKTVSAASVRRKTSSGNSECGQLYKLRKSYAYAETGPCLRCFLTSRFIASWSYRGYTHPCLGYILSVGDS